MSDTMLAASLACVRRRLSCCPTDVRAIARIVRQALTNLRAIAGCVGWPHLGATQGSVECRVGP